MRKQQKQTISTTVPTYSKATSSRKASSETSSGYKDNENITLDSFLYKFYQAGEKNLASKALPFYAHRVDRYFSMKNVTKKDILKDKKRYYKKWVKRRYRLINYDITDSSSTDRAKLYTVKATIYWEVTSAKGNAKQGTSTNILSLYHNHSGIVVTSIK